MSTSSFPQSKVHVKHRPATLTRDVLIHTARLVADDKINWPTGLTGREEVRITAEVRKFRRARLVKLVASQIAADIARDHRGSQETRS